MKKNLRQTRTNDKLSSAEDFLNEAQRLLTQAGQETNFNRQMELALLALNRTSDALVFFAYGRLPHTDIELNIRFEEACSKNGYLKRKKVFKRIERIRNNFYILNERWCLHKQEWKKCAHNATKEANKIVRDVEKIVYHSGLDLSTRKP